MKVLLLTDSNAFAGTERHMLELAKGLSELGVAAEIGCPDSTPLPEQAKSENVACRSVARGFRQGILDLRKSFVDWKPDLIHAHNGRSSMMAAIAGARRGNRCRLVSTLHFISLARDRRRGLKATLSSLAHSWLDNATSQWVAISDAVANAAIRRHPASASRITRVHNGITPVGPIRTRDDIRRRLGIAEDVILLVSAIRLEQEKDVPTLIRAAEILSRSNKNWRWLVAGDGALAGQLKRQVQAQWPGNSPLEFLGRRNDIADLMRGADIFIHPAPAEPFGLVLIEAMAQSTPVIASSGGAAPEIVVDGQTGWLFSPGDSDGLAAKINNAIASNDIERVGQAAATRLHECFTADRMARETLQVYGRALGKSGQSLPPAVEEVASCESC